MGTAVKRNNQTCQFITFLRHVFYKTKHEASQIMNKTMQKLSVNISLRDGLHFSHNGSYAKLI